MECTCTNNSSVVPTFFQCNDGDRGSKFLGLTINNDDDTTVGGTISHVMHAHSNIYPREL